MSALRNLRTRRWIVVLTSMTLFIVSLTQIGFVVDVTLMEGRVDPRPVFGLDLMLSGWTAIFAGPTLGWAAMPLNFLLWPSIVALWVFACKKWLVAAAIAALCTIALSLVMSISESSYCVGSLGYSAWLANPGIALTCWLFIRDREPAALILALSSLALSLTFLLVRNGPFGLTESQTAPVISYGIGYWLWVASAATLTLGVTADVFLFRRAPTTSAHNMPTGSPA